MTSAKTTEKEITTSITLDSSLYKAVKHLAIEENKTIKDIVSESLKAFLQTKGLDVLSE